MPWTKEKKAAYMKEYRQTPVGKKTQRISHWKAQGIIVEDWNTFYDYVLFVTHCQMCKKQLTIDKRNTHSTRCVDHDHTIKDKPNVRMVCCNACNVEDSSTNTSGEPNIYYDKTNDIWRFEKTLQGKKYTKAGFKTKTEAIDYKHKFNLPKLV
tara:strand:- start:285 stop:743 length:459 start_codon:yes stop_codon:yes gene_type:complete